MSLEKRKILSSTDQGSAEKRIRMMEEKQMSEKKVQNISTEIIPAKEQSVSSPFLSSYIKSCSQTHIESTILDHTWKIDQFMRFSKIVNTTSSSFPETGQYAIQMNVLRQAGSISVVNFYIRTSKTFNGSCTTTVMYPPETVLLSNSILGNISDMKLLIGIPTAKFQFNSTDTLLLHCKFEIFHVVRSNTIRMNLQPTKTIFKEVKSLDDSTLEFGSKNKKSITFIVGGEQYVISRKLLYDTNSSYFKDICLKHEGNEKDMINELVTYNEVVSFKQILLYILTGSVDQCDYDMLKKLLTTADKYDVPSLKLTCERYLVRHITITNALELIQLAFSCNATFLEAHSASFIQMHIKEIMNTKKLKIDLN